MVQVMIMLLYKDHGGMPMERNATKQLIDWNSNKRKNL